MDARKITAEGRVSDFRLSLDRVGDRVVATLTGFHDPANGQEIRHESEPNWNVIARGFETLQCPEDHRGEDVSGLARELGEVAFGVPITQVLAKHRDTSLVRLWLNPDRSLSRLPWEVSSLGGHSSPLDGFVCLDPGIHLIRELSGGGVSRDLTGSVIKVLVVWADPASEEYPHLEGIANEVKSVMHAFSLPECQRFHVRELPYATAGSLTRVIQEHSPDIVHFIGHGDIRPTGGVIVLESGAPNQEVFLHGDEFAEFLAEAKVKLVVLTGCMTGDAISGVATELGNHGIPAIVAMQAPIHDASAGLFARAFYSSLVSGDNVDQAVLHGRQAIRGTVNDWAVPVLLRSPFDSPSFDAGFDFDFRSDENLVRHNLTYDDRPFIGRHQERGEVRDRITVKRQRLVTITGMGGMGKTRLAKQVASEVVDDFPDGVWMVECDTLSGRDQLIGAIVSTLGLTTSISDAEQDLIRELRSKRLLLFLDCFEGLVEHSDLLDSLLRHSAETQLLVTSRILLGISREFEYRLSPMNLKRKGGEVSDGVSLFLEAAAHSTDSFVSTARNKALVRELCDSMEGVPLAVILAAGRLRHLSLVELLEQVRENPLDVLKRRGGPKDRQADLYRVVSTSFMLLDEGERDLLDKLSLFVGSFDIDDAADVCGARKSDMFTRISILRDHSLVQVQTVMDRTRYKLLDTVREVLDQLPRSEVQQTERHECAVRHAEKYTQKSEAIGNLLAEGRVAEAKLILWREIGNFRAASELCAAERRFDLVKGLVNGLARMLFETSLYVDFEKLADAGFAAANALSDPLLESKLCGLKGAMYAVRQDESGWRPLWLRRIDICQKMGDLRGCADTLTDIASEYNQMGKFDEAEKWISQGVEMAQAAKAFGLLANFYAQRSRIAIERNDNDSALNWVQEASRLAELEVRQSQYLGVWQYIGITNEALGRNGDARRNYLIVLRYNVESDTFRTIAWSCLKLAAIFERMDQGELALLSLMACTKLQAEVATRHGERAKSLLSQFLKRQGGRFDPLWVEERKTPWRELCRRILATEF